MKIGNKAGSIKVGSNSEMEDMEDEQFSEDSENGVPEKDTNVQADQKTSQMPTANQKI